LLQAFEESVNKSLLSPFYNDLNLNISVLK